MTQGNNPRRTEQPWMKPWVSPAIVLLVLLGTGALLVALYWVPWAGFDGYSDGSGEWHAQKKLWDWMDLLLVPVILASGAAGLAWLTSKRDREVAKQRADMDREREEFRAKQEDEREEDRAREASLQTFLDRMSDLLLKHDLGSSPSADDVRDVARARTLTSLRQLDGKRKGEILRFLYEAELIGPGAIVSLVDADLKGAELSGVDLRGANLLGAVLDDANLFHADLREVDLTRATLVGADLRGANLVGATLQNTILKRADLKGARLDGANMQAADLGGAKLEGAILKGANVTDKALGRAEPLRNTVLPDGTMAGVAEKTEE